MLLKVFPIFSSGSHNHFSNFGRRSPKKQFNEIILKSDHWPRKRCRLKVIQVLALAAILFSGAEPF